MGLSVTNRPDKEIDTGYDSRWLAVNGGYPVFFTLFRKDYALSSVQDDGNGFTELRIAQDITTELTTGHRVFFLSATLGENTVTVTNFSYNGSHTLIQTDHFFSGSTDSDADNYINLISGRSDYKAVIQVWGTDSNTRLFEGRYTPAASGRVDFDAAGAIRPQLTLAMNDTYPSIRQAKENSTQPFYIKFAEYYSGVEYQASADIYAYKAVNAANQLLDSYGENMGDRVAFNADISPKAKWLSSFESPRFWPDYPFRLGVIVETQGTSPTISRYEESFNNDGSSNGTNNTAWPTGTEFDLLQESSTFLQGYPTGVCEVDIWLESDLSGDPCTTLSGLTEAQKWNFSQFQYDPNTFELIAVYVEPNPISGISSVSTFPQMTVTDGTNSWAYQYNASLGYYEAVSGPNYLIPGTSYTASITSLDVVVFGQTCSTSFEQLFKVGVVSGEAPTATALQLVTAGNAPIKSGEDIIASYFYDDNENDAEDLTSTIVELWAFDNPVTTSTGTKIADLSHESGTVTTNGTKLMDPYTIPLSAVGKYLALKVTPYAVTAPIEGDEEIIVLSTKVVKDEAAIVLNTNIISPQQFEFTVKVASGAPYYLEFSDGSAAEYYEGTGGSVVHGHTFNVLSTPQSVTVCTDGTNIRALEAGGQDLVGTLDLSLCTAWNGVLYVASNPNLTAITPPTSGTPIATDIQANSCNLSSFSLGYFRGDGTGQLRIWGNSNLTSFTTNTDSSVTDVQYERFWGLNNNLTGTLDCSKFLTTTDFRWSNNPNLTGITFQNTSTAPSRLNFSMCGLTGNIDLTNFLAGFYGVFNFGDNSGITGFAFPAKSVFDTLAGSGFYFTQLYIYECGLVNPSFVNLSNLAGDVRLEENTGMLSVTFPSASMSGTFSRIRLAECGLTSAIDISNAVNWTSSGEIDYRENTSLPSVDCPVMTTGAITILQASNVTSIGTYANHDTTDLTLGTSSISIGLSGSGLSSAEVDTALVDLDSKLGTGTGDILINSNAAPGATGLAAVTSLTGKGYTVTTD